jgi:hypothetical protein
MNSRDDRELEALDNGLARLFAGDQPVPADFTLHVLRRVQDRRWKREVWLGRVLYAGLCASGILVIAGLGFAFATLPRLSGDAAMRIAVVALVLTGVASWPRLSRAGLIKS